MSEHEQLTTANGVVSGHWVPMAGWGRRVAARLIDEALYLVALTPYFVGWFVLADALPGLTVVSTNPPSSSSSVDLGTLLLATGLMLLGSVLALVAFIWNRVIQQGRTGQSIGKSALSLHLVSATSGTPIGAGTSFLRELAHVLDGFFYLGYLWPLWDRQKQTFADKIVGSVVAHAVAAPGPAPAPAPAAGDTAPGQLPGSLPA